MNVKGRLRVLIVQVALNHDGADCHEKLLGLNRITSPAQHLNTLFCEETVGPGGLAWYSVRLVSGRSRVRIPPGALIPRFGVLIIFTFLQSLFHSVYGIF